MKAIYEAVESMVGFVPTVYRLLEGYRPALFVPVVHPRVLKEDEREGVVWPVEEGVTTWDHFSERKAVTESVEYRDENGVEYEQFAPGDSVYVFNRVFPGSLQMFEVSGGEINPQACGVCGGVPAAEMYHGPDLCGRCYKIVGDGLKEKAKTKKETVFGVTTKQARDWCEKAGVKLGTPKKAKGDFIPGLPEMLARGKGEYKPHMIAQAKKESLDVILEKMEMGELTVEDAQTAIVEGTFPKEIPRRLVGAPIRVEPSLDAVAQIEEWYARCAEDFGFAKREAMPHGVVYFGEGETSIVAFDHLLDEESKAIILEAAEVQRLFDGDIPLNEADVDIHSVILPEGRTVAQEALEEMGLDVGVRLPVGRRNRVRFVQAASEKFVPGSIKTVEMGDGVEVTFGTRAKTVKDLSEKAWGKFDEAVEDLSSEDIESALTARIEKGNSGLGRKLESVLNQIDALGEEYPDDPADKRARLRTEKMKVQKILYPVSKGDADAARKWAEKHGYKPLKVTTKDKFIHVRVAKPKKGRVTRTFDFGKGIKAVGQRIAASVVRVYDDPADDARLLREMALHTLIEGADKVARTGPRSWALGYPDGSSRLLLYFPRNGIARLYEKEFMAFQFDPSRIDDPGYTLAQYKKQHHGKVPWKIKELFSATVVEKAAQKVLRELRSAKKGNRTAWTSLMHATTGDRFENEWKAHFRDGKTGPPKKYQKGGVRHDSFVPYRGKEVPMDLLFTTKEDHHTLRKKIARGTTGLRQLETSDILLVLTGKKNEDTKGRVDVYVITPQSGTVSPQEKGTTARGTKKAQTRYTYGKVSQMKWIGGVPESAEDDALAPDTETPKIILEAIEPEEENIDDRFDNIVRKLVVNGSLDALQDVEFDEQTGSIYLFFASSVLREEADEIVALVQKFYGGTKLVASPDQSLEGEVGESDWWVVFVPGALEGAEDAPKPEIWGATKPPTETQTGMDQDTFKAVDAIAQGVSVDKAIDALTKESVEGFKETEFNAFTFAVAVARHYGVDENSIEQNALSPNAVFLDVQARTGRKRLEFAHPHVGGGVNVCVIDGASGHKENVGNFKSPELSGLFDRLDTVQAWTMEEGERPFV